MAIMYISIAKEAQNDNVFMQSNRALRILFQLAPDAQKEFSRYLDSPFFNRSKTLQKIVKETIKTFQKHNVIPQKEGLFRRAFPQFRKDLKALPEDQQREFMGKKLDPYLYDLRKHLEDFLVWKGGQKEGMLRDYMLTQELAANGQEESKIYYCQKAEQRIDKEQWHHPQHRLFRYLFAMEQHGTVQLQGAENFFVKVQEAMRHLDLYMSIQKLNVAYAMNTMNYLRKQTYHLNFMDAITAFSATVPPEEELYIAIFSRLIVSMEHKQFTTEEFRALKSMVLSKIDAYPKENQHALFRFLTNYIGFLTFYGTPDSFQDFYEVLKFGLEKRYLLNDGYLSRFTLRKAVVCACEVGKYEEAEQWLTTYQPFLKDAYREETHLMLKALVLFESGYPRECIRLLNTKAKNFDQIDKFREKQLRARAFYDLDELELFEATVDASRKQLERAKDLQADLNAKFSDFFQVLEQLYRQKLSGDYSPALTEDIRANRKLQFHSWLLRKALAQATGDLSGEMSSP